jgi:hypothetical protein
VVLKPEVACNLRNDFIEVENTSSPPNAAAPENVENEPHESNNEDPTSTSEEAAALLILRLKMMVNVKSQKYVLQKATELDDQW